MSRGWAFMSQGGVLRGTFRSEDVKASCLSVSTDHFNSHKYLEQTLFSLMELIITSRKIVYVSVYSPLAFKKESISSVAFMFELCNCTAWPVFAGK